MYTDVHWSKRSQSSGYPVWFIFSICMSCLACPPLVLSSLSSVRPVLNSLNPLSDLSSPPCIPCQACPQLPKSLVRPVLNSMYPLSDLSSPPCIPCQACPGPCLLCIGSPWPYITAVAGLSLSHHNRIPSTTKILPGEYFSLFPTVTQVWESTVFLPYFGITKIFTLIRLRPCTQQQSADSKKNCWAC
jgi:hypothetical protein